MVAERLRGCLGPGDLAARLGGDEFAVLVPQVADEGEAVALGERMAAILRTPVTVSGREVLARASVGVRLARGGDEDPERLLRDADMAMYAAKTAGRAGVRVFDTAMHTRAVQRLDFEAALRRAVIRQQFTVRYQPVVELPGGRLAGLEALVRWDHPERGLVMPGEFVALAEDTGLIVPIGRWVLHAACQAARDWQRRFPLQPHPFLSVNLSVRQLQQPDLLEDVAGALDASGLDPDQLMLEITESVLAADQEAMLERLSGLRALGVHLAIDDFGTGYSPWPTSPPPRRRPQAGQAVRGRPAPRGRGGGPDQRHPPHRRPPRPAGDRRGHRAGGPGPGAGPPRLPLRPGLPLRPAPRPVRRRGPARGRAGPPPPGGPPPDCVTTPSRGKLEAMLASLTGLGLSAAAGLNAYIPLLLVGVLARFTDVITLPEPYRWIQSGWAIAIVSVLLAAELILDKVAVVDHVNDAVQTLVRPTVGGVIFAATTAAEQADNSTWMQQHPWAGVLLGVVVAGVVHATKATARPIVNVTTVGTGTPFVSAAEDVASLGMSLVAVFLPILVVVVLLVFGWAAYVMFRRARRRRRSAAF